jgi:hypothetical protein
LVGFAIPEKWQSVQKKGQAETCPYPQKEAKMKTYIYDTTKLCLVNQKAEPVWGDEKDCAGMAGGQHTQKPSPYSCA